MKEREGIFEISCDNAGYLATSLCPKIKFFLNLYTKSIITYWNYPVEALTLHRRISPVYPLLHITQITIIDFTFQSSLQKQANKFNNWIVPQLNGIEVPVSDAARDLYWIGMGAFHCFVIRYFCRFFVLYQYYGKLNC